MRCGYDWYDRTSSISEATSWSQVIYPTSFCHIWVPKLSHIFRQRLLLASWSEGATSNLFPNLPQNSRSKPAGVTWRLASPKPNGLSRWWNSPIVTSSSKLLEGRLFPPPNSTSARLQSHQLALGLTSAVSRLCLKSHASWREPLCLIMPYQISPVIAVQVDDREKTQSVLQVRFSSFINGPSLLFWVERLLAHPSAHEHVPPQAHACANGRVTGPWSNFLPQKNWCCSIGWAQTNSFSSHFPMNSN